MTHILSLALIFWPFVITAAAQEATVVAPHAYKLQFENDWVRVVRVRYGPREKVVAHDHPKTATVYVYLRDSGPVRFTHVGGERWSLERPPVKAGGFRLAPAARETHEVESLTDAPTDFLRVELKTQAVDAAKFRGRYPPDPIAARQTGRQVRFENGQVRVTRVTCAAHDSYGGVTELASPSLWVAIRSARLRMFNRDGSASDMNLAGGQTLWVEPGREPRLENLGDTPVEFLRIDLKTGPTADR